MAVEALDPTRHPLSPATVEELRRPLSGHGKMLGAASSREMTQIKSVWMKVGE
jgi:hypothetical protein